VSSSSGSGSGSGSGSSTLNITSALSILYRVAPSNEIVSSTG